jgi:hypothetical protein
MNLSDCINCGSNHNISVKYTAAYRVISWKEIAAFSSMLSVLVDIVIWPIPLCMACSQENYVNKLKRDLRKFLMGLLASIGLSGIALAVHIISVEDDLPILATIAAIASGGFAFYAIFILPLFVLQKYRRLKKFKETNIIPRKDEELPFIGMAEEIINSKERQKYKDYVKPKLFILNKMPFNDEVKAEINNWRSNRSKYEQNVDLGVYQNARKSRNEMIDILISSGEISKLPFPDEWMKEQSKYDFKFI